VKEIVSETKFIIEHFKEFMNKLFYIFFLAFILGAYCKANSSHASEVNKNSTNDEIMLFYANKNCNDGDMNACAILGGIKFTEGNYTEARVHLGKSCNGGVMMACDNLGEIEKRKGNLNKASALWKKACDGGYMGGCLQLGDMEKKKGNHKSANALFKKACVDELKEVCKKRKILNFR
jgi:TPR repeat protein